MICSSFLKTYKNAVLLFITAFFVSGTLVNTSSAQPTASFSATPTVGCAPLTVDFTNSSLQSNVYFWNFGNGNTSTLQNPTTVYLTPGFYTVTLIATNSLTGQKDTMTATNYIHTVDPPNTNFTATPLSGCENNNNIAFTNTTTGAVTYTWDFGDGNSSTQQNPVHQYAVAGTYTVKLIAANGFGCNNIAIKNGYITILPTPNISFSSNYTSTCNASQVFNFTGTGSGITSWNWSFGDGATSALQNPSHTYNNTGTYNVTLIATGNNGCTDTLAVNNYISIGNSLVTSFTVDTAFGCGSITSQFSSTVPNATSWSWNFGDGGTSTLANPLHQYTSSGNYTVTLGVTTVSGCNGSTSFSNAVVIDPLPNANFNVSQPDLCDPYTWHFNNTSTNATSYIWDFGDSTSSTQAQPTHTYAAEGVYNVTLHVFTNNGCEDSITINGAVNVHDYRANFGAIPKIGCAPLLVSFGPNPYPGAVSWFWQFGDGNTSTLQNPSNNYTAEGAYNVTLIITTAAGCKDTLRKNNFINVVPPQVNYTVPDTIIGCTPFSAAFTDPTYGSNQWHWDFGDGDTSNLQNPSHVYPDSGIYTVTLQSNMAGGCGQFINPYAIVQVIPFVPEPILLLSISPCGPYTVHVVDSTPGVTEWHWDFGDGTTSTQFDPTHVYAAAGTYLISVNMIVPNGCPSTQTFSVTVGHTNPIRVSTGSTCVGDSIFFSLSPPGAFSSQTWDFGDGSVTSNLPAPYHLYNAPGDYLVTLSVTDTNGCVDTFYSSRIYVRDVTTGFTTNDALTVCDSTTIHFVNTSANATAYEWNFGDSTTATSTNPAHVFNIPGTYTVSLTATAGGCIKTLTKPNYITVNKALTDFSFVPNGICLPLTVTYTDQSTNAVSWLWDFGDGQTSALQNPVHVFYSQPSSNVTLTITDNNGCVGTKSKVNISTIGIVSTLSDSIGCSPLTINFSDLTSTATTWHWDFGDGVSSTLQNPQHTYNDTGIYDVTLIVTLASGCTDTTVYNDYIRVTAPIPDFLSPTVAVCAPSLVNFTNLSLNGVTYLWDFGDGTTSAADNPSHIYNIPGYYTIQLTAYDALGCARTETKVNYIHVPGTYAHFSLVSQLNCLQNSVQFSDSSLYATSWSWNFGDGYTSTDQNPLHLYQDTGSYIVSLITSDSLGCSSYFSYPDSIVVHPNPDANGNTTYFGGCGPYTASFNNTSTNAVSFTWHFGDGDTSTLENPVHVYTSAGIFNVSIVAVNEFGCTDTFTLPAPVAVQATPDARFTPSVSSGCTPLNVQFTNTSINLTGETYLWDFGNGQTSASANPAIIYSNPGTYTIKLIVLNSNGCVDSTFKQVTVYQTPDALGDVSDTIGCGPFTTNFTNTSINASTFLWVFGDGNTSALSDPSHTYNNSNGTYHPYLIASSANGCVDTLFLNKTVHVNISPTANFTSSSTTGCPGTTFMLTDGSSNLSNPSYNWSIGTLTSTDQNPSFDISVPGFYNITLLVTNDTGCSDTIAKQNFLQIYDNVPPPVTPLISVSVKNNTSVEIKWLPSAALDLEEYQLYRLNTGTNSYDMIYSELHPNNSNPNVTGVYTDNNVNTLQNVYTYKMQTIDRCGYKLNLNSSTAHTTINVTAQEQGQKIQVNWTPYGGCPVASYEINRVDVQSGTSQFLASVPASQLSYMDENLSCPFPYSYRITARDLCGNPYTSLSDTSIAVPENTLANQKVDVVRSTVVFNKSVLTEWGVPNMAPDRVLQYNILRSTDNLNFSLIASVPASVHSYIDDQVDVDKQYYYYKVDVISDCNLAGLVSNNSSSILLQSDWVHEKTKLWWTEYNQWDTGVDYYTIEKKDDNGQWIQVKIVNGTTLETDLDE